MSDRYEEPRVKWQKFTSFLTGIVAAPAIVTLLARHWWIADLIANLRVQLILALVGTILMLTLLRRWKLVALTALLILWQSVAVQSAFLPAKLTSNLPTDSDAAGTTFRVLLANVLTHNQRHELIVEQIRTADPDVFVILELSTELNEQLRQHFGLTHTHTVAEAQDNGNFGIGLWSKTHLSNAKIFHLNAVNIPSIEADMQLNSQSIHVVATHPLPPVGARNFAHRNRHLSLLVKRLNENARHNDGHSTVLLSDLNLTPWSPNFEDFLVASHLRSAAAGRGLEPTWYRWSAFPFGLVLDHGLMSENVQCTRRTILAPNGSDHRAVVFDFQVNAVR